MVEGHILKFLSKEQPQARQSKRFIPSETYGNSRESPEWFKRKFSLQSQKGYEYKYDKPEYRQKFNYLSQKHTFRIDDHYNHINKIQIVNSPITHSKASFNNHLKKGLLSEYLDNNAWMKAVAPLNGFQRNEQGRRINNQQRKQNIQTARLKSSKYIEAKTASNFYSAKTSRSSLTDRHNQIATSYQRRRSSNIQEIQINSDIIQYPSHQYNTISVSNQSSNPSVTLLMSQKQKIRSQRNEMALNKISKIQKFKIKKEDQNEKIQKLRSIDSDFVKQRMAQTARQWKKGRSISGHKSIQKFDSIINAQQKINFRKKVLINPENPLIKRKSPQYGMFDEFEDQHFISNQF